jgi:hypothetical protein
MNDKSSPEELFQDARHMAEVYFGRFEREAERLLADLQSNGDIQITGPEERVLKRRSTVHDRRCIPALRRRKGHKTMFASIVRRCQAWRRYETVNHYQGFIGGANRPDGRQPTR